MALEAKRHEAVSFALRPACSDDEAFLYELYCGSRSEEMAAWGWDPSQQEMFLKLQFDAQRRHYELAYEGAEHAIILVDDRPAGRIVVFRSEREIRLVDVSLAPEERGRGIGAAVISDLIKEARAESKPLTLHVAKGNRAAELYKRLGFSITNDSGTDYKMEWRTDQAASGG